MLASGVFGMKKNGFLGPKIGIENALKYGFWRQFSRNKILF